MLSTYYVLTAGAPYAGRAALADETEHTRLLLVRRRSAGKTSCCYTQYDLLLLTTTYSLLSTDCYLLLPTPS